MVLLSYINGFVVPSHGMDVMEIKSRMVRCSMSENNERFLIWDNSNILGLNQTAKRNQIHLLKGKTRCNSCEYIFN